ncbi:MAG: potassium transporter TrkG [Dehalococcoidales bacterium]|nr:potassium transporter TrkG [Dehalococcoidales bacterium]
MPGKRVLRVPLVPPKPTTPLSSIVWLVYVFGGLIGLGSILLTLPVSSASGHFTTPLNAIFTATSAVSITGLVVVDTGTYWSTFGQGVLLALIQIGGFGFIVGATLTLMAIGGRFSLRDKLLITESMGFNELGGVIGIVVRIAIFSVAAEAVGSAIFYFRWFSAGGSEPSLWTAIFHSVSAFNNSGMDLFGNFSSLSGFRSDAITLLTTALIIILGSTGYIVFADLARKRSFVRLTLDTKIVLVTTGSLLALGTLFYLIAEYSNSATLGPFSFPDKISVAFFQSTSPRTAGFSAIDMGSLKQISLFFTMLLMFIGGTAGSVSGGVKVNTIGVLVATVLSVVKGRENIEAFGRQLARQTVYRALSIFLFYLGVVGVVVTLLSITEKLPIDKLLFESFSALGTVGLSTGITPDLSIAGRIIISFAMIIGRLAPLSFMVFLLHRRQPVDISYPHETIRFG